MAVVATGDPEPAGPNPASMPPTYGYAYARGTDGASPGFVPPAPRADEPGPNPPPGTVKEQWWERSAFHLGCLLTVLRVCDFFEIAVPDRSQIVAVIRDTVIIMGGAFGLPAMSPGLRRA